MLIAQDKFMMNFVHVNRSENGLSHYRYTYNKTWGLFFLKVIKYIYRKCTI